MGAKDCEDEKRGGPPREVSQQPKVLSAAVAVAAPTAAVFSCVAAVAATVVSTVAL